MKTTDGAVMVMCEASMFDGRKIVARGLDDKVWIAVEHGRATCQAWEVNPEVKAYRVTRGTEVIIAWLRSRDEV